MSDPILTQTQKRHATARHKVQSKNTLTMLNRLVGSKEVKDMLSRVKVLIARLPKERLYLTRSGLIKEWDDEVENGGEWYGDMSWRTNYKNVIRSSKVQPSLRIVNHFRVSVSRLREISKLLKA